MGYAKICIDRHKSIASSKLRKMVKPTEQFTQEDQVARSPIAVRSFPGIVPEAPKRSTKRSSIEPNAAPRNLMSLFDETDVLYDQ